MDAGTGAPGAASPPRGALRWLRALPTRSRFWGIVVPVHLAAFTALYVGTLSLLERAYVEAGAAAAQVELDQAVHEVPLLVQGPRRGRNPHVFEHLLAAHLPLRLRLYRPDASAIGQSLVSTDAEEVALVRDFLASDRGEERTWVERADGRQWVRGLVRVRSTAACTSCHRDNETLGVATMRIDFTERFAELHAQMGQRLAMLLGAWLLLIGGVTLLVQRSVRRSAARLEADLQAAASGEEEARTPVEGVPLDPVTARVHGSLRRLVRRQRERERDVVRQLAHADQLATLGQLAAGLAHEIKNPLAGIQGALEVLRDEEGDSEQAHLFSEMLAELGRVNGILQRLLESGRAEPLRLVLTDLSRLLADVVELLQPSLRRQRVELQREVAAALPEIEVDPAKIRQVLVNLIQNASEAMQERGGKVRLLASTDPDQRAVVLTVEDDGPGIPAENIAHLFEPFFTTKFTGTGLGLAISKSLVEQHGGEIDVTSEPGHGSSFVIVLPIAARAGDTVARSSPWPSS